MNSQAQTQTIGHPLTRRVSLRNQQAIDSMIFETASNTIASAVPHLGDPGLATVRTEDIEILSAALRLLKRKLDLQDRMARPQLCATQ